MLEKKNYFYFCSVNYPFPIFSCLVWSGFLPWSVLLLGIGFLSVVGVDSSCISLWARRHGYHFILFKNGYYEMCILFYASRDEETKKKKERRDKEEGEGRRDGD